MKLQTLKSIIEKKKNKSEFAIITNLKTGESEIFEKDKPLSKEMHVYLNQINEFFKSKKNGVIENSEIFWRSYRMLKSNSPHFRVKREPAPFSCKNRNRPIFL